MAARRERGLLDPDAAPGESPFDHHIYCLASDGDIEEGVSSEASSLAGTQRLGNLTLIYDSNRISIEDDTNIALSEDVAARYAAYGWHVQTVDWTNGDTSYVEDVAALARRARGGAGGHRPAELHPAAHDHRLAGPQPAGHRQGPRRRARRRRGRGDQEGAGLRPRPDLRGGRRGHRPHPEAARPRPAGAGRVAAGLRCLGRGQPARARRSTTAWSPTSCRPGWDDDLPSWERRPQGHRDPGRIGQGDQRASPRRCPSCGAARPTWPSRTTPPRRASRASCPPDRQSKMFPGHPYGRVLHFGIREHAMGAIMNGIKVHGGTRPYGGTFLTFSDYMRPAVRLSALMRLPVIYVWTHDSIGLGEDGPTHQPIEHLAALRAIPGLDVVRPADANETAACWVEVLRRKDRPAGLILTRQALPIVPRGEDGFADTSGVAKGAYVLSRRRRRSRRDPGRHRLGGAVRGRGAAAAGRRGHLRPGGVDAVPRVVRRAGPGLPRLGHPARGQGPGERRGRSRPAAGGTSSATRAGSSASTTTAPARREPSSSRSSASAARRSSTAAKESLAAAELDRCADPPRGSGTQGPGGPGSRPGGHDQLNASWHQFLTQGGTDHE